MLLVKQCSSCLRKERSHGNLPSSDAYESRLERLRITLIIVAMARRPIIEGSGAGIVKIRAWSMPSSATRPKDTELRPGEMEVNEIPEGRLVSASHDGTDLPMTA